MRPQVSRTLITEAKTSLDRMEERLMSIPACRKTLRAEKMTGTLTLSILKSVHTLISPIIFYKLCSVATPRYPKPLLLENHVRIVALTPNLQRVSFNNVTEFLYHSSTTKLIQS